MYVCCVLICCIGCKWQGFGSGIVQQCLLWEEIRGCPVPDMSGSSQLHNGPTGGQSWAQQPSVWCLWKHLGKVRTVGGMEEGNGGTLKSCVWDAPWSTRYTPKRDCSPRMSPCWGRYTPQDTAACEGHAGAQETSKKEREEERICSILTLTTCTSRGITEGTECDRVSDWSNAGPKKQAGEVAGPKCSNVCLLSLPVPESVTKCLLPTN